MRKYQKLDRASIQADGGDAEEQLRHERQRTSTVVRYGGLRIERSYEADTANRQSLKWSCNMLLRTAPPIPREKLHWAA